MKVISFSLKEHEPKGETSPIYNFTPEQRDTYIEEIRNAIKVDLMLNEIREAESRKWAEEFIVGPGC